MRLFWDKIFVLKNNLFKKRFKKTRIFFLNYIFKVGEWKKTNECDKKFYCEQNGQDVTVEILKPCSKDALCIADKDGELQCVCKDGFIGNGFECILPVTQEPTTKVSQAKELTSSSALLRPTVASLTKGSTETAATTTTTSFSGLMPNSDVLEFSFLDQETTTKNQLLNQYRVIYDEGKRSLFYYLNTKLFLLRKI